MEQAHMLTDACSARLPFSYRSQRKLCLSRNYDVSFPTQMLGSEAHLKKRKIYLGECLSTI